MKKYSLAVNKKNAAGFAENILKLIVVWRNFSTFAANFQKD